jgi:hypothetical protein
MKRALDFGASWAALGLVLSLTWVASAPSAWASPATLAPGLKAALPPTGAVEPAQFRRRPFARLKQRLSHRPKWGNTSSNTGHKPPRNPTSSGPVSSNVPPRGPGRDPPRGPKHNPQPGPWLPPAAIFPGFPSLPPEQADVLRALPRRVQQAPANRSLQQRVARQILVLVDQTRPQSLGGELGQAYGLELLSSRPIALLNARAELFRVRDGRSEAAALAALQRDPRIRSAQFNWRYFHTGDTGREGASIPQYGPRKVHLQEAHQLALGRNVTVAVIDSAVDSSHPDLAGAVVRSFDLVGDKDALPDFHGTAVAGIIHSRGVVEGVAPQAGLLAVRAFRTKPGAQPETTTELVLAAVDWAVSNGAKVLNMSFVGPRSGQLLELLEVVSRKGVVLVAAAGNGGPKAPPAFPAAFPGVIAVTAVDAADRRYPHANRGRYIAVAAPGVDVLAPVEGGKHELLSGTSFATAYVSGIAALLLERDPTIDAAAVARLIASGADDLGPVGRDDDFGAGRVNALSALKSVGAVAARQ